MELWRQHAALTRRYFLQCGAAGAAALPLLPWAARGEETHAGDTAARLALAEAAAKLEYLTLPEKFGTVERGNPLPYTHPPEKLREVGLTPETWKLEVFSDPEAPAKIEAPLTIEQGTALDWTALMKLAERHAVRFFKVMTCNNGGSPLGMGLWEGVPLREVVWLTRPQGDLRRAFYYGYHNDDPKQRFQSSLPIGRVLEDPPGESPVILCYKLNGQLLSGKRGGPVRMIVPEAYGFKNVKWLQKVVLTNAPFANDTYAGQNNDIDSWLKTFARFLSYPSKVQPGRAIPLTGVAQVGISGLSKVQYSLHPADAALPADDPHLTKLAWHDAQLLAPPTAWGGGLPDGQLPALIRNIDPATNQPTHWPQRHTLAHWAALAPAPAPGPYHLRCRTLDSNNIAQPMPRPFPKSGRNSIQQVTVTVEEA